MCICWKSGDAPVNIVVYVASGIHYISIPQFICFFALYGWQCYAASEKLSGEWITSHMQTISVSNFCLIGSGVLATWQCKLGMKCWEYLRYCEQLVLGCARLGRARACRWGAYGKSSHRWPQKGVSDRTVLQNRYPMKRGLNPRWKEHWLFHFSKGIKHSNFLS